MNMIEYTQSYTKSKIAFGLSFFILLSEYDLPPFKIKSEVKYHYRKNMPLELMPYTKIQM